MPHIYSYVKTVCCAGLCLLLAAQNAYAQSDSIPFPELRLGEWRQHLPWQNARYVSNSKDKVYFATQWAILAIDKAERTPQFISKVEGLSETGVSLARYNRLADALLIVYENSNIDIWRPDGAVTNLPFIRKNNNIIGDKNIYDIAFEGQDAYLACGFGIVKMSLSRAEVIFTVFTGVPVRSFAVYNGALYAGTDDGVFRLPANDANPADFSRWQMPAEREGFPPGGVAKTMAVFDNKLYLGVGKQLLRYDGSTTSIADADADLSVLYLSTEGEGLVVGWKKNFDGRVAYIDRSGTLGNIHGPCQAGKPLYAVEDGAKKFWFADDSDGFRFYDAVANKCENLRFNSPFNHFCSDIAIARNKVYVASRGADVSSSPIYSRDGIYLLDDDGQWKRFSSESNPELSGGDCDKDLWRVAPHPQEDKFFAGSFVGGLVAWNDAGGKAQCYNQSNSKLQNAGQSGANRTAIGAMAFDADNNLWIGNYGANAPVAVLKPDGQILNFSAAPSNILTQAAVDQNGYKWFVVGFNGGVMVYDSGEKLDDPSDDRWRSINTSNSVLETNSVLCLEVDLDGNTWVGTRQGVFSFECGENIFKDCRGTRQVITVDGFGGALLSDEEIRTIAVDGANRKWFGTANGIFVRSPDGREQVARFTSTNSPLFDNAINDIAINQQTGEVWIATAKGILSLRGEAIAGGKFHTQRPYAYPNPVRPGYEGPIAIYGLARDANIKITDIAGNLVYEGVALGGQAVWDGRDYLGRKAASGVYLIYAVSSGGFDAIDSSPDTVMAKLVIVR